MSFIPYLPTRPQNYYQRLTFPFDAEVCPKICLCRHQESIPWKPKSVFTEQYASFLWPPSSFDRS